MISVPFTTVDSVIKLWSSEIHDIVKISNIRLSKLEKDRTLNSKQKQYVQYLKINIHKIIVAKPASLKYYKGKLRALPKSIKHGRKKTFKDKVLDALRYSTLRSDFYPMYFHKIGIKACVYCNAQLTISVEKGKEVKAKFQVDHYLPKSEFPCFSISLYNLYPVCASCNNSKSAFRVLFDLYSDQNISTSNFHFKFKKGCVARYLLSRDMGDIEIDFFEPKKRQGMKSVKLFNEVFDIKGIYDTQRDVAEELILKSEVYTKHYREKLARDFPKIFSSPAIINRLILGAYVERTEIHKRPLSKFYQDLAEQLDLIHRSS